MDKGSITISVPVVKEYAINRIAFRGTKFMGDCSGLAYWYFTNINM